MPRNEVLGLAREASVYVELPETLVRALFVDCFAIFSCSIACVLLSIAVHPPAVTMLASTLLAGLLAAAPALAAQLTKVNYPNNATSKVEMYVYVPDKVQPNPALVVVIHSCQSTAQTYFQNNKIPWKQGSDRKGYITIWPSSPHSGTCWDVSSKRTLSHEGGGDNQAIANMILYGIQQYKADPAKVFVTGGSSGGESFPARPFACSSGSAPLLTRPRPR